MSRKLLCSMLVMVVSVSFVAAEDFVASITKVDGDKVTFQKYKKGEKGKKGKGEKDGDPVTMNAAGATVAKTKFSKGDDGKGKIEAGDKIEKGLKDEMFSKEKLGETGVFVRITTEGEGDKAKITEILTFDFKKKKKDAN